MATEIRTRWTKIFVSEEVKTIVFKGKEYQLEDIIKKEVNSWHLTSEKLPKEKRLVIAYVPDRPWGWDGEGDIHYALVWLEKGISLATRARLSPKSRRKKEYYRADEHGNNLRPYCWESFGPDYYFGQEVLAWKYLEEFKEDYE